MNSILWLFIVNPQSCVFSSTAKTQIDQHQKQEPVASMDAQTIGQPLEMAMTTAMNDDYMHDDYAS